jgi:hypothetical protein
MSPKGSYGKGLFLRVLLGDSGNFKGWGLVGGFCHCGKGTMEPMPFLFLFLILAMWWRALLFYMMSDVLPCLTIDPKVTSLINHGLKPSTPWVKTFFFISWLSQACNSIYVGAIDRRSQFEAGPGQKAWVPICKKMQKSKGHGSSGRAHEHKVLGSNYSTTKKI